MNLNTTQRAAVDHPGHCALVACPGSGKTRTLVGKLVRAVEQAAESPRLVACITYTNAAVNEIESRVSGLIPQSADRCEVETIHTFCLKHIIGPHAWLLDNFRNGFSILPPDEPRFDEIVERVRIQFNLRGRVKDGFEQLGRGTDVLPTGITTPAATEFWRILDEQKLMDFSSVIYWSLQLVLAVPYIARGLASRYRWILVDEFQDTSELQVGILREIHRHGRTTFFMVGDPYQSIMSFAGAKPGLLAEFGREIGARLDIELSDNYRSSKEILSVAERVCLRNAPLVASGPHRDFPFVPIWLTSRTMLDGICNTFLPEVQRLGIRLSEVAILANRWTSLPVVARGLRARSIPVIGPGARPYRRGNHAIAPLIEELAAHASDSLGAALESTRREISRMLDFLKRPADIRSGFELDVTAARLCRVARELGSRLNVATDFLKEMTSAIASGLLDGAFIDQRQAQSLNESGRALIADIAEHENQLDLKTTTIGDLGLFARRSEAIRLMTMHGSKGREFDAVALIDVFDGHVPFFTATPGDEIEAEGRRLLYVAVTRPRKLLMLLTLAKPDRKTQPSRFLPAAFPGGSVDA